MSPFSSMRHHHTARAPSAASTATCTGAVAAPTASAEVIDASLPVEPARDGDKQTARGDDLNLSSDLDTGSEDSAALDVDMPDLVDDWFGWFDWFGGVCVFVRI